MWEKLKTWVRSQWPWIQTMRTQQAIFNGLQTRLTASPAKGLWSLALAMIAIDVILTGKLGITVFVVEKGLPVLKTIVDSPGMLGVGILVLGAGVLMAGYAAVQKLKK